MTRAAIAAAVVLLGGCERILGIGEPSLADDPVDVDAAPPAERCDGIFDPLVVRQVVLDAFDAPLGAIEATDLSFDLDGDGTLDNQMFNVLSAYTQAFPELDLQATIDEALADGALLHLVEVRERVTCASTRLYAGADRDDPANPADDFSGEETFAVVGNIRGRLAGARDGARVLAGDGGTAELRLPLFPGAAPIDLPLVEARITYTVTDAGLVDGVLGGAIRADLVDGVIVPSFAASLAPAVARDCPGVAPDCCGDGTFGATAVAVFDADDDCEVTEDELRDDSLIQSLFSPDLDLYDGGVLGQDGEDDAISFGIGFTAVHAFFLSPEID